ncbi:DUF1330 domain-containing protein [Rhodobacteraceae bacterium CCMM004]|nr:DUF1330 domain-containing protein [Rhodobacteraceae bacterium CCMM004]
MSALWIAHVEVTDPDRYAKYAAVASEVIPAHGGTFIARAGRYVQLEGRDRARNVVARFPSVEAALAAYNDPRYQAALADAHAASDRDLVIVEET